MQPQEEKDFGTKTNILRSILLFLKVLRIDVVERRGEECWEVENGVFRNFISDNTYTTVYLFGKVLTGWVEYKNVKYLN